MYDEAPFKTEIKLLVKPFYRASLVSLVANQLLDYKKKQPYIESARGVWRFILKKKPRQNKKKTKKKEKKEKCYISFSNFYYLAQQKATEKTRGRQDLCLKLVNPLKPKVKYPLCPIYRYYHCNLHLANALSVNHEVQRQREVDVPAGQG